MMWPYVLLAAYITPEREHISAGEFAIRRGAGHDDPVEKRLGERASAFNNSH